MTQYEGWKNRETWTVNLWLTNDEYAYDLAREMTENLSLDEAKETGAIFEIADRLESYFSDNASKPQGMMADLMDAALARVEWAEIAESLCAE